MAGAMSEAFPGGSRFTVDDLFSLAAGGVRGEVLDGRLLLAPPRLRRHERVVDNLAARFRLVLPDRSQVCSHAPVRLPDGDGPVPDLLVTTASGWPSGWPVTQVHTVVEVVATDGRYVDRVWKRQLYADAGIPCYWRVELTSPPWLRSSGPVVVVRVREPAGWREIVVGGGGLRTLPVAYGRGRAGAALTVSMRLDPRSLVSRPVFGI